MSSRVIPKSNFASKSQLLKWLNSYFHLNPPLVRLEDLANGALLCQVLDSMYPDVPLEKVNFYAQSQTDISGNYKILQKALTDNKGKPIVEDKLKQGKYHDILTFLQWAKSIWDVEQNASYDPIKRRQEAIAKFFKAKGQKIPSTPITPARKAETTNNNREDGEDGDDDDERVSQPSLTSPANNAHHSSGVGGVGGGHTTFGGPGVTVHVGGRGYVSRLPPKSPRVRRDHSRLTQTVEVDEKSQEVEALLLQLHKTIEGLEKERDYFYEKLQGVEDICLNDNTAAPDKVSKVLSLLYADDHEKLGLGEDDDDESDLKRDESELKPNKAAGAAGAAGATGGAGGVGGGNGSSGKNYREPLESPTSGNQTLLFGDVPITKEDTPPETAEDLDYGD